MFHCPLRDKLNVKEQLLQIRADEGESLEKREEECEGINDKF